MPSKRFKVNPAKVVHETIEGEAIVIHLESGCYYSIDGVGAEMWGLFAAERSLDEVAGELETRYAAGEATIAAEVERLAQELADEDLLESTDGQAVVHGDGIAEAGVGHGNGNGRKEAFTAPVLTKYTDMQDFLLVDPIHQTADAGWPEARPEA